MCVDYLCQHFSCQRLQHNIVERRSLKGGFGTVCVCVYSVSFSDTALTVTGQGDAGCSSERAPLNWMWKE